MTAKTLPALLALVGLLATSVPALADDSKKDAGAHFDRGVALSNEADYSAALVEFRRAYEIAPNPLVLYNIAQTYFQLRNYAGALTYFERYLAESGASPAHGAEVEQSITTLKQRVGKVDVTSNVAGEVSVDDEPSGKAPQTGLRVSVGRHRITVKAAGSTQERSVDISAGDTVPLSFTFGAGAPSTGLPSAPPQSADEPRRGLRTPALVSWVVAGTLGAGAIVTGIVALNRGSALDDERANANASRSRLDSLHGTMRGLSVTTDALIAGAVVAGGVALYFTLSKPSSKTQSAIGVAPNGLQFHLAY